MHGPLLIPRVPPGSFITTQISPVSAIGGAGPGCWLGDSGSSSRSVSTGAGERRGERREGDILVTLHLAPGHLGTWNLGKVAAGVSIAEESTVGHWAMARVASASGSLQLRPRVMVICCDCDGSRGHGDARGEYSWCHHSPVPSVRMVESRRAGHRGLGSGAQ